MKCPSFFRPVRGLLGTALVAFALAGCGEDGPSGPGTLKVTVSGTAELGAALIDFAGPGLGTPTTGQTDWVHGVPTESGVRVVAVSNTGGSLFFEIPVDDLGRDLPTATVVRASRDDDRLMTSLVGITVAISR